MHTRISILLFLSTLLSCANQSESVGQTTGNGVESISEYVQGRAYEDLSAATFAGGCFWCTEASFERIQGVRDVVSGYAGGAQAHPTYDEVSRGKTDHAEAIMVYFDPEEVDYRTLLEVFFVAHDPTQLNRQGPDVGKQYRSAIYYHNDRQKEQIAEYIRELEASDRFDRPIVTEVEPYDTFWVAEAYHQDYYEHHPENPYIQKVSRPKVEKVEKMFADILKEEYRK